MLSLLFRCLVFVVFVLSSHLAQAELKIVAYQKYNTMGHFDARSFQYLDQLIYKLIRVESDGKLQLLKSTKEDLALLVNEKQNFDHVKLLVGVGGAKFNSKHFPKMAKSATARASFIQNLVKFCQDYQIDGVDLDWEYPKTTEEKQNALLLFKETKKVFDKYKLVLTAAVNYSPDQVEFAKSIEPYVHQINLMVYEPMAGLTNFQQQIDFGHKQIEKKLLRLDKLVVGLPFYGRDFSNNSFQRYSDILSSVQPNMSYLNQSQIETNTKIFKDKGYFGVMFWELGFDASVDNKQSLLKTIYHASQ